MLGRYAICGTIGAGGMATVHVGRLLGPVGFSRTVAIKRMHSHLSKDPEFVTMFLEEARIAARVQHVNVVATLDVVSDKGELFHVMDYVEGESFAKLIYALSKAGARLPLPVVGAITSQALHGLHAVHETRSEDGSPLELIHRDISPDNILVGRDGTTRVLDFGIAKAVNHGRRTQAGQIKGKVAYMSPEQLRAESVDRRADIYSTSAVLWEALTGKRLVEGQSEAEMVHCLLTKPVRPPSAITPSLSRQIDEMVMRGLSRAPAQRWATARDMAMAIEQTLGIASPATVAALVEEVMGTELAKKAAIVESAVKRVAELTSNPSLLSPELVGARTLAAPATEPRAAPFSAPDRQTVKQGGASSAAVGPGDPSAGTEIMGLEQQRGDGAARGKLPSLDLGDLSPGAPAPQSPAAGAQPAAPPLAAPLPRAAGQDFPALDLGGPPAHGSAAGTPALAGAAPAAAPPSSLAAAGESLSLDIDFGPGAKAHPQPSHPPQQPAPQSHPAAGPQGYALSQGPPQQGYPQQGYPQQGFGPPPSSGAPPMGPSSAGRPPSVGPRSPMAAPVYGGMGPQIGSASKPSAGLGLAIIAPIAAGALILVGVVGFVMFGGKDGSEQTSSQPAIPPPTKEEANACEVLRKRLLSGGSTVGQSRAGWAVELWLRGPGGQKLGSVDTSAIASGSDLVEVKQLVVPGKGIEEGVVVRVRGQTAEDALDEGGALKLIKAADGLFDKVGAEAGALTLKCAHLPHNDIGLWFRGKDLRAASGSLLFAMGMFAEKPVVKVDALETKDVSPTMPYYERLHAKLYGPKMKDLKEELQRYSGTVDEPAKDSVRITFPVTRANDATRASRVVADKAGVEDL